MALRAMGHNLDLLYNYMNEYVLSISKTAQIDLFQPIHQKRYTKNDL